MNAGGMPNTCKSNGICRNEYFGMIFCIESGKRVSNTWIIYLLVGDSHWKRWVIPHNIIFWEQDLIKDLLLKDESALYQLVGEVMAHQGYDG